MGRLRIAEGGSDCGASEGSGSGDSSCDSRLAEKFESWRHDPDLCLVWAAFCTTSPLTLADGVLLAKTRRSATEALSLLAGTSLPEPFGEGTSCGSSCTHSRSTTEDEAGLSEALQLKQLQQSLPRAVEFQGRPEASDGKLQPVSAHDAQLRDVPALQARCRESIALSDPLATDLAHFRRCVEASVQPWQSGGFTIVARLAKSMHAEVHYLRDKEDSGAVAKVVPKDNCQLAGFAGTKPGEECNERSVWLSAAEVQSVEDLRNEIAVLRFLQSSFTQCPYIIRLHGAFEDPTSLYLVTEYCDEGDLFERVAYGEPLAEMEKKRYISELLQAVQHLHRHNIGHRDISLENVLLRHGSCVLMDFGQAVRLRTVDGTVLRYFIEAGKRMYRSPEMYVPRTSPVQVVCPAEATPGTLAMVSYEKTRCEVLLPSDAMPGKPCSAVPYGYDAARADVFACGVCAFVLIVGKPPWVMALDTDPTFSFIRRHGVTNLLQQWRGGARGPPHSPSEEESLLAQMLRVEPARRSNADECLRSLWLDAVAPSRTRSQTV